MGIGSSVVKAWKGLVKSNTGKSLLGGLGTFFGLEWLTSGGLVTSTSETLGVSETSSSILLIITLGLAIYLAFRYLDSRIPVRKSGGRRR